MSRVVHNTTKHIDDIYHYDNTREIKLELINQIIPNYPYNCRTLNMTDKSGYDGVIGFSFNRNTDAFLFLEDRLISLNRANAFAKLSYKSGPQIHNDPYRYKVYILQITQNVFVENDKSIGCRNYPTEQFATYNDCDEEFTERYTRERSPVGLVPFWATRDLNRTTTHYIVDSAYRSATYAIPSGQIKSDCPMPCTSTEVAAR
jgi:hypothetical protein